MKQTTVKRLYALSGNRCAFPKCPQHLVQRGVVVGEMCHIKGKKGGPRYDPKQSKEEREAFENFVMMCSIHHKIIDTNPDEYPVLLLQQYKERHERDPYFGVGGSRWKLTPDQVEQFIETMNIVYGDVVTSVNQQGGQTAHTIVNVNPAPTKPQISLTPIIECHRTSTDNVGGIDYYAFRVSLHNDSEKTIRSFRLEVEIPNEYADPTHLSSMRGRCEVQGDMTVYTHTEEGHPGFVLYPRRISDLLMNNNYIMRLDQYEEANGDIRVRVYFDDELVGSVDFSIADNRNKDRMNQLGL